MQKKSAVGTGGVCKTRAVSYMGYKEKNPRIGAKKVQAVHKGVLRTRGVCVLGLSEIAQRHLLT